MRKRENINEYITNTPFKDNKLNSLNTLLKSHNNVKFVSSSESKRFTVRPSVSSDKDHPSALKSGAHVSQVVMSYNNYLSNFEPQSLTKL